MLCARINSFIACSIRLAEKWHRNLTDLKRFLFYTLSFDSMTYKTLWKLKWFSQHDPSKADNFISETERFWPEQFDWYDAWNASLSLMCAILHES